ncbi:hypothetical protein PINS_up009144 [Pythium insidiosum]|nr:hypothetical protein PINS_up009144 [Pythium insidiosum]
MDVSALLNPADDCEHPHDEPMRLSVDDIQITPLHHRRQGDASLAARSLMLLLTDLPSDATTDGGMRTKHREARPDCTLQQRRPSVTTTRALGSPLLTCTSKLASLHMSPLAQKISHATWMIEDDSAMDVQEAVAATAAAAARFNLSGDHVTAGSTLFTVRENETDWRHPQREQDGGCDTEDSSSAAAFAKPRQCCNVTGCLRNATHLEKCSIHKGMKLCQVDGCCRPVQSRGCCKSHGGGARCKQPGCVKGAISRGRCRTHGGGTRCAVPECNKWAQRFGCCVRHSKTMEGRLFS